MSAFESYSVQLFDTISKLQKQFDDINLKHEELNQDIKNTQENGITEEELIKVKTMMDKTLEYNNKLLSLRTTMVNMSIKSKQLIQRSDKLKATKLEYLSKVDAIRKIEQERDKSIAAEIIHNNVVRSPSPSSSSISSLKTKEGIIVKNKKPSSSTSASSSPLISSSPLPNDNNIIVENKSSPTTSLITSSSSTTNNNNNNNKDKLSRSSSSSSILTPSSPNIVSTDNHHQNSSSTIAAESAPTVIAVAKKKKRKPKVREIVIDDDDSGPAWVPKRSLSSRQMK